MSNLSKTTFKKADRIVLNWAKRLDIEDINEHLRLERLLLKALPMHWQSRCIGGGLDNGVWTLYVSNGSEAYQLRFLAPEIEAKLATLLPYPPKLKIMLNADIWKYRRSTTPPALLYQQRYSDAEAKAVMERYINKGLWPKMNWPSKVK